MSFSEFLDTIPGVILVQGVGFIAMALGSLSYQQKNRSATLIYQGIASVFWMTQLLMLEAWSGAILNLINIFRGFLLAGKEKHKWISSRFTLAGVLGAFAASGVLSFFLDGPISLVPLAASFIQTFGLWSSDKRKLRLICMSGSFFWIVYNGIVGTIAGVLCEFLNISSIFISFWRFKFGKINEGNATDSASDSESVDSNDVNAGESEESII